MRLCRGSILTFLLAASLTSAHAQAVGVWEFDNSQPISIDADSMEVEQPRQLVTFSGAVNVRQGDLTLDADQLAVHYREDEESGSNVIHRIEATGSVHSTRPGETARGDAGIYDVPQGIVTLTGNVVLTSAEAGRTGNEATLNLLTGESLMTGGEGGRVNVLFDADNGDDEP